MAPLGQRSEASAPARERRGRGLAIRSESDPAGWFAHRPGHRLHNGPAGLSHDTGSGPDAVGSTVSSRACRVAGSCVECLKALQALAILGRCERRFFSLLHPCAAPLLSGCMAGGLCGHVRCRSSVPCFQDGPGRGGRIGRLHHPAERERGGPRQRALRPSRPSSQTGVPAALALVFLHPCRGAAGWLRSFQWRSVDGRALHLLGSGGVEGLHGSGQHGRPCLAYGTFRVGRGNASRDPATGQWRLPPEIATLLVCRGSGLHELQARLRPARRARRSRTSEAVPRGPFPFAAGSAGNQPEGRRYFDGIPGHLYVDLFVGSPPRGVSAFPASGDAGGDWPQASQTCFLIRQGRPAWEKPRGNPGKCCFSGSPGTSGSGAEPWMLSRIRWTPSGPTAGNTGRVPP